MVVISVYTYGVKIIKKFRWESGFLERGGSMEPRYALTEVRGYLMQLSVNLSPISSKSDDFENLTPVQKVIDLYHIFPFILTTKHRMDIM